MNKLVPLEPTKEMIKAAYIHYESDEYTGPTSTYKVMLEASPPVEVEPVLYAVEGYKVALQQHNGATLCTGKPTELHTLPLYTSPPDTEAKLKIAVEALNRIIAGQTSDQAIDQARSKS